MLITCNGFKLIYNKYIHGVSLLEAADCIFSTVALVEEDLKHSTVDEKRFKLISSSPKRRVVSIVICKRQQNAETRIISARCASKKERRNYFEKFGTDVQYRALSHESPTFGITFCGLTIARF